MDQALFVFALVLLALLVRRIGKRATEDQQSIEALAARVRLPASYLIGVVAGYRLIARIDGYWS